MGLDAKRDADQGEEQRGGRQHQTGVEFGQQVLAFLRSGYVEGSLQFGQAQFQPQLQGAAVGDQAPLFSDDNGRQGGIALI